MYKMIIIYKDSDLKPVIELYLVSFWYCNWPDDGLTLDET